MKIIDITREYMSAPVYPGDPSPELHPLSRWELGDGYNMSALSCCLHNATHVDAPLHFCPDGADIAALDPAIFVGECQVVCADGVLLGDEAERLLGRVHQPRLLLKGNVSISPSAAAVFAASDLVLIGVEGMSVADAANTAAVHRQLLNEGKILLESLDLHKAQEQVYLLIAAPIKIAGADGAPVRAMLLERQLSL